MTSTVSTSSAPSVSIAIPLYRSRRFVERVVRNVERIDYPNVDVIVSDRHMDDDALDIIAARFCGDRRVRTVKATDRLNWIQHYNQLLREATGRYFMWMPHDDDFPATYVSQLVTALEERPDAVLAYGHMDRVDLDGRPTLHRGSPDDVAASLASWSQRTAVKLLIRRQTEKPFRGVFRRDVVVTSGLSLPMTLDNVSADLYWVFGLALLGPFTFVPSCVCTKSYYPTSTHASWGPLRLRHLIDGHRVLLSLAHRHVRSRRDARFVAVALHLWLLLGSLGVAARRCGIPAGLRRSVQQRLSDALSVD